MRQIKKIIVNCSGTDEYSQDHIGSVEGYHYFINKLGRRCTGLPLDKVGKHTPGENMGSVGVCLSGRFSFQKHQFRTLEQLIYELREKFGDLDLVYEKALRGALTSNLRLAAYVEKRKKPDTELDIEELDVDQEKIKEDN